MPRTMKLGPYTSTPPIRLHGVVLSWLDRYLSLVRLTEAPRMIPFSCLSPVKEFQFAE
jgi:hypothetical protein